MKWRKPKLSILIIIRNDPEQNPREFRHNLVSPQKWDFLLSASFFGSENPCFCCSSKTHSEAHGNFSRIRAAGLDPLKDAFHVLKLPDKQPD